MVIKMQISLLEIAEILKEKDNFYILTHKSPDGDTIGSAYALYYALKQLNKKAKVLCSDDIPRRYDFLYKDSIDEDFEPSCIISVDIADLTLLGENLEIFSDKIDICIDHHIYSSDFAKFSYVNPKAGANCENIFELLNFMGVKIDETIANCLYTGISTDTGCFRYSNVTANTHKIAAQLIERGAKSAKINKLMFDTKSRAKVELENKALDTLEFFCSGKGALICITKQMLQETGAAEEDTDSISSIPRKIENVLVGVTIKERTNDEYKISVRTDDKVNAAKLCFAFGGGGHQCAGGCTVKGELAQVKAKIIEIVEKELMKISL